MTARRLRIVSATIGLIGFTLVILMATTEGEPGALPLALVLTGAVGWSIGWRRRRR